MRPIWMENIIKLKRLTFAEEIGVLFKTVTKPYYVKSIKSQLVKLIKIKIDPNNVTWIISRVKVAIKSKLAQDKDFVSDEKLVREPRPDYVCSCSQLIFDADNK